LVGLLQAAIKGLFDTTTASLFLLAGLPWMQDAPADAVEGLLTEAISSRLSSVAALLQLPGAQQLGAGRVLGLLAIAANVGLPSVTRELGRWVGRQLVEWSVILSSTGASRCCSI